MDIFMSKTMVLAATSYRWHMFITLFSIVNQHLVVMTVHHFIVSLFSDSDDEISKEKYLMYLIYQIFSVTLEIYPALLESLKTTIFTNIPHSYSKIIFKIILTNILHFLPFLSYQ